MKIISRLLVGTLAAALFAMAGAQGTVACTLDSDFGTSVWPPLID